MSAPASVALSSPRIASSVRAPLRSEKIGDRHWNRLAFVYVRQSTPQQLVRHQESTQVQYALRERAVDLGWPADRVTVIDEDLGKSGATSEGRAGFQRLVAEVTLDHVGLILGLEMSRLARSCKDWYQLLEVCGVFGTLIADPDGVYDPSQYNDRLLLGLKGTMSEAELHILKQRMNQGRLNKASRGELLFQPPIGYLRRPSKEIVLDPDEEVQEVVRLVFRTFEERGTVHSTLRHLVANGVRMPVRVRGGPAKGDLEWRRLNRVTLLNLLRNPMYAGAYAYGRRAVNPRRKIPGRPYTGRTVVAPEDCHAFIKDRFPRYITWEQYQAHGERLQANRNVSEAIGSPRRGPSILAGIVVCGMCGRRMSVRYGGGGGKHGYWCSRMLTDYGGAKCQNLAGPPLDRFVAAEVLRALEPASLELSLEAAQHIEQQRNDLDVLWQKRLERAAFEAQRAERHYQRIEPENRLVARELGRQWEEKLAAQRDLQEEYERLRRQQPRLLTPEERSAIRGLAADLPALWNSPTTTDVDRKEILRQVVDRVVVNVVGESERVRLEIRWAGGACTSHEMVRPVARWEQLTYWPALAARVRELAASGLDGVEMARRLNEEGWRPPKRRDTFVPGEVNVLLRRLKIGSSSPRPKERAGLTEHEEWISSLADRLDMPVVTVYHWLRRGWVQGRRNPDGRWILRADPQEMERLRTRRQVPRGAHARHRYVPVTALASMAPALTRGNN